MLHAEVLALQTRLGISYKDAAYCLFMAEVEQVKKAEAAGHLFSAIVKKVDVIVDDEIVDPIRAIDGGLLDPYELRDGLWVQKLDNAEDGLE